MLPLRQSVPPKSLAVVNHSLVVANSLMFAVLVLSGPAGETLVNLLGFIPARFFYPAQFHYSVLDASVTLVTSLFLHGGFVHIIGNMLYLSVFGSRVEEAVGHSRYLLFFLAGGAVGSITHAFVFPISEVPSIGASGSIAAVLGAFLVLYPAARIVTLFPLVVSWALAEIPAIVFLPFWFITQLMSGWLSLASTRGVEEVEGVAWWAHVGGFIFGAAVGLWIRSAQPRPASIARG